jgi:hypothetical protein
VSQFAAALPAVLVLLCSTPLAVPLHAAPLWAAPLWAAPLWAAQPDDDVRAQIAALHPLDREEVLWLARGIYSESNRVHEQELVAWVIRNRVETNYRGSSYRGVVLEPLQFSAFNSPTQRRARLFRLGLQSKTQGWAEALAVALKVYRAPAEDRPFSIQTRHFYSPISMEGRIRPTWAEGIQPLDSRALGVDPERFLFFESVDERADPYLARRTPAVPSSRIARQGTSTANRGVSAANRGVSAANRGVPSASRGVSAARPSVSSASREAAAERRVEQAVNRSAAAERRAAATERYAAAARQQAAARSRVGTVRRRSFSGSVKRPLRPGRTNQQ